MINNFLKLKTKNLVSLPPTIANIKKSNRVLFSIFTRYGDTIIALTVIKEFVEHYPEKVYLILCPKQMKPYVGELLPNIECIGINKRNIYEMYKIDKLLKKRAFDIGFNPWSNGLDSSYFISYCNKFLFYKDFERPRVINHYQVVRRYLKLPEKDWETKKLILNSSYKNILICPESSDSDRSLTHEQLNTLLTDFRTRYKQCKITIASMDKTFFRKHHEHFVFKKTAESSYNFLVLAKQAELMVCADSGPLHIALVLKKNLLAVLNTTLPNIVINTKSCLLLK